MAAILFTLPSNAQTNRLNANPEETVSSTSTRPASNGARPKISVLLGAGDLLDLKVFGAPELGATLRVSGNGEITVPLIGSTHVAGLTPEQAQNEIEHRFRDGGFLREPHVSILVREFASQGISVLGEVTHPGIYPLLGAPRLLDALAAAGGTTTRAGKTIVVTHRDRPEAPEQIVLSAETVDAAKTDIDLRPGDTVVVSRAGIVYVTGDVRTPGGFLLDQNETLTVLQAIALAQGLNATASLGNARIIHREASTLKQIPIELKPIMEAKAPDVELKDGDVLFVPNSASKSAARKSLESIVQVATGLAIYRR